MGWIAKLCPNIKSAVKVIIVRSPVKYYNDDADEMIKLLINHKIMAYEDYS